MARRTFAEVEALARKRERDDTVDQMCRVLKHHMGLRVVADELWRLMNSPEPKREKHEEYPQSRI